MWLHAAPGKGIIEKVLLPDVKGAKNGNTARVNAHTTVWGSVGRYSLPQFLRLSAFTLR